MNRDQSHSHAMYKKHRHLGMGLYRVKSALMEKLSRLKQIFLRTNLQTHKYSKCSTTAMKKIMIY